MLVSLVILLVQATPHVDGLSVDLAHPLRSFRLELTLAVDGDAVALAGPSGAGKTSILRAIAGLFRPDRDACARRRYLAGYRPGHRPPAEERSVGYVFQDYALFPHLTIAQNVGFGGRERVGALLERFQISHLARARPSELSGGERQRVALARALPARRRCCCSTSRRARRAHAPWCASSCAIFMRSVSRRCW